MRLVKTVVENLALQLTFAQGITFFTTIFNITGQQCHNSYM